MEKALPTLLRKNAFRLAGKWIPVLLVTALLTALPGILRKDHFRDPVAIAAASRQSLRLGSFVQGITRTGLSSQRVNQIGRQQVTAPVQSSDLKASDWFKTVKKDLDQRIYSIASLGDGKTFSSINPAQGVEAHYQASSLLLEPASRTNKDWKLTLQLKGVYADDQPLKQGSQTARVAGSRDLEYQSGDAYSVQYHNDEKGVRENFIILKRPSAHTHELKVGMHVEGDWVINKVHDRELHFARTAGQGTLDNKITYSDLRVWDATGRALPARMVLDGDHNFDIIAQADHAVYPVTIDPLATSPSTSLTGGASFGVTTASAGDVNGDGFSDVIVGDGVGNVTIYLGSASGLSSTPATTLTGLTLHFGISVAGAGDVNGDGFSDVVIGDGGGNVYVFNGSNTGIASGTAAGASATLTGVGFFGGTVAGAGNVNGDNYSDIIVGDGLGDAFIFTGSGSGIVSGTSATAATVLTGSGNFGATVAAAGDVNADGFGDVIIGDAGGNAFVFNGSGSGIASGTSASASATLTGAGNFGFSVSGAGDVNGDGYTDVVVGDKSGNAYEYNGSAGGISSGNTATASTHLSDASIHYGVSVASAGDVNGDGFSDVIVGNGGGNAFVYFGSVTGLATVASPSLSNSGTFGASVASAGDINGDGYSDVVVGDAGGNAYTYVGSPTGSITVATVTLNGQNAGDQFGYSVSSAGDVNGDGYSDVIVGANGYVGGLAGTNLGAFYIYNGGPTGLSTTPSGSPISGPAYDDNFGISVASAGDVDGDGYGDVIIGGIGYSTPSQYQGIAYFYRGSSGGIINTPTVISDPNNSNYDQFGYSVSSAGDVNGDGYADVIIGAIGAGASDQGFAYIYMGSASGLNLTPISLTSATSYAFFGTSVANAGDVNGDGYSDVIVGTLGGGGESAYIYFGSKTGIADAALPSVTLTGSYGNQTRGSFGASVSSAGDVNGDGFSDVLVGAPSANGSGTAALFLGSNSGTNTTAASVFYGVAGGDQFGINVATAGDVNGDGYSDILIKSARGPVYLYQGSSSGFPGSVLTTAANTTYTDGVDATGDTEFTTHQSVASAGDVNGDGYSDVISGVYETSTKTGTSYVYYGNGAVGHNASNVLRLYNTDLSTPIQEINLFQTVFGLGLFVQSPYGKVNGRLVWEEEPNGTPFTGNPITNSVGSTSMQAAYGTILTGGYEFKNLINKVNAKATKIRARIQYQPTSVTFGQVYSPWIYSQTYLLGSTPGVLPVSLLSFTATAVGKDIDLKWKTAQEENSRNFIIEHSLDGNKFTPLDSVNAKGNTSSTSTYAYTHLHPAPGVHFYKLKEMDLDGNPTYSKIVSATILADGPEFSVYPNPTSDQLVITYNGVSQNNLVRIMDGAGNVVRQYNLNLGSTQTTVSLKGLAKGSYFVQLVNSSFSPKMVTVN